MRRIKTGILYNILICVLALSSHYAYTQSSPRISNIHFYQLNTSHGLSDNYIQELCTDKSGNLWIGTGEGLNMFNGKTVIKFFPQDYPALANSNIRQIECDDYNRIWLMTGNGSVTVIDEHRKFHRVGLYDLEKEIAVRRIFQSKSKGIILFTNNGHLVLDTNIDFSKLDTLTLSHFIPFTFSGIEQLQQNQFRQAEPFSNDKVFFGLDDGFYIHDHATGTLSEKYNIPGIRFLSSWAPGELLVFDIPESKLKVLNLRDERSHYPLLSLTDQFGNAFQSIVTNAMEISPGIFVLTTSRNGIYIYDRFHHKLVNHRHNAADPTSLVNNTPYTITTDSTGWVFIGATPHGISYFKSNAVIGQQSIFMDKQGNSYDGYISSIATLDNVNYFIGTNDDLLAWNRNTNTTQFLINKLDIDIPVKDQVNYVAFDNKRRLWACIPGQGICVLDENHNLVTFLNLATNDNTNVPENYVRHMTMGPDGNMWLCTRRGVLQIDPISFIVKRPAEINLKKLEDLPCDRIWFEDEDNIWIASRKGAWHYEYSKDSLTIHDKSNGLLSNIVFTFNKDTFDNIYIGSDSGLDILLRNGKRKSLTPKDGLLNNRVEALLLDKSNRMWIGNDVGLGCFSISDTTLKVFDERYGLSVQGFRINSYHQNNDDELIWGTERGIQYFYPDELFAQEIKLLTTIHRMESRDIMTDLTRSEEISFGPGNNFVNFYFTTIDYSTHLRTFYQYKLEGEDKDWVTVSDQTSVRYNSLEPGNYVFNVRASNDGKVWVDAQNMISINIAARFWDKTWFRVTALIAAILGISVLFSSFNKKQKQRNEELETEGVINYFASRINLHQTTDELLWDVAKNCISKLAFEDCVIYLLDEEREVLIQKAAFGPKSSDDLSIHHPIEIPVGTGIVGSVARTGKPELIPDTRKDPRYIVDDTMRLSELAVPIILDEQVIGVIDSEHSKKNFFTLKHLGILKTIAVLCINQIQRNHAEEEKQKAKIEVLQNKQKATESRLQSLRLQMNPHFLFNALNSIQQMILANEEMIATKYLSRFSKLLRSILIHSDKENISLKEELEILKLYVELESVRFKEAFSYEIICDEDIDTDELKIPTLLIQPFVENAIWHGLMHKEGIRKLKIEFTDENDYVRCTIEDNGIGRQKSTEIKLTSGSDRNHTGKGIKVSLERLRAMQKNGGPEGSLNIQDLFNNEGEAIGTRVEINLPVQN